ncbi:uncharacterized protein LOC129619110 [Condylostylus longicornis]|uniref:uncharacterized protein LOC129619110 n=1 Tax=Condylostylus longicornis TaxID=2530218 RepID=UPI00244D9A3C|nr:uncharacterized protein LOC129619110 [Condylostylus longicornis]
MTTKEPDDFDNQNRSKEHFVHLFLLYLRTLWENIKTNGEIFLQRIGAYEVLESVAQMSAKHPYLALVVSVLIATFVLPFLIIFGFALLVVILTFTGFILIEGTLITIVSVLLFGCLAAVLLVLLFFGGLTLASYLGFMHVFDLYNGINKTAIKNFLKKENSRT